MFVLYVHSMVWVKISVGLTIPCTKLCSRCSITEAKNCFYFSLGFLTMFTLYVYSMVRIKSVLDWLSTAQICVHAAQSLKGKTILRYYRVKCFALLSFRFSNKGKDKMQSNEKQKNLQSLSKGTNSQTERRFLTKSEQEERRQIQREMMNRIRELMEEWEIIEKSIKKNPDDIVWHYIPWLAGFWAKFVRKAFQGIFLCNNHFINLI